MALTKNAQALKLILLGYIKEGELALKKADDEKARTPNMEKPKGGSSSVDASVPVGPKGIPPKAPNMVGKEQEKKAKIDKRTVGAAAGALGAAAGAGFMAGRFKKKDSKEMKEASAALIKDGPLTVVKVAGYVQGYMTKAPTYASIEKIAALSGVNVDALYERVMQKFASGMLLPLIGGALAGGVAVPAVWQGLRGLGRFAMDPMGRMSRPQNMANIGGFSPMQSNRMQNLIMQEGARSNQMSSMMQGLKGAYTPAPNPWGTPTQAGM